ncbi:MAG TPA: glycoside hydrolase family 97 N-terminal domain-containing protein [Bacteroidales bacterium]|nr:glycoside hydrolase family 97 N-terminal domain-containing protein [Bacteroidales bacterium]
MKNLIPAFFLILFFFCSCSADKYKLKSPDGRLEVKILPGEDTSVFSFELYGSGKKLLLPSSLYLDFAKEAGIRDFEIISTEVSGKNETWVNNFGERKIIPDNYNELKIRMKSDNLMMNLIFRAYNEGVAFNYEFPGKDSIVINDENILFSFTADHMSWSAPRAQALYRHVPLSRIDKGCERPLVIEKDSSAVMALGEAGLIDYPRMKFDPDSSGGYAVKSRLEEHAVKSLPFRSPWRYVLVGGKPGDLLENNYMILNLNDPTGISDISWIKPGKALREITLTTAGGKAAVDFTSTHGMQYVEFDAGWYGPENNDASDARSVNVDPARSKGPLDLKEVIDYAAAKDIGIILYVNRKALERQIDSLLPIYRDWGVKGIKFGFVRVGSQEVTSWLHESVKKAAAFNMVVDIHDEYRPTGFSRTFPNLLTQEGIRGDEESPANTHTLITMFTRMIAGAGDNTVCYYNERVDKKMGSHASQLAKTVCIFSPLQFLYWYDKAAEIGNDPELEFFRNVPTVWDETKVLHAKISEYGVIARKKGEEWFIGGINGEKPVNMDIEFRFLDEGKKYMAKIYTDDPAIETVTHVRCDSLEVDNSFSYPAVFKANTGLAIHLKPVR